MAKPTLSTCLFQFLPGTTFAGQIITYQDNVVGESEIVEIFFIDVYAFVVPIQLFESIFSRTAEKFEGYGIFLFDPLLEHFCLYGFSHSPLHICILSALYI